MAAEAFGSLCKDFIASFLTSAQMSTLLAWIFFHPGSHPLCAFLLLGIPMLLSLSGKVGWGPGGGDLLVLRFFFSRRELVRIVSISVQRCAHTRSGSPPLTSFPCLDSSTANKPSPVPLPQPTSCCGSSNAKPRHTQQYPKPAH